VRSALAKLARLDPTRLDLRLPRPWVCVLLVLSFLGFGVIVGRTVAGTPENALSASVPRQLRLVLPAAADSSTSQSPTPPISEAATTPSASSPESSEAGGSTGGGEGSQGSSGGGSQGDSSSGKGSDGKGSGPGGGGSGGGGSGGGGSGSGGSGSSGEGGSSGGSAGKGTGGGSAGKGKGAGGGKGSGGGSGAGQGGGSSGSSKLPPVKHVFLIMLADQPYASVFGPSSAAPYLADTLEHRGELLVRYYGVAHDELADGIALLSGQGPTPQTEVNCPTYAPISPTTVGAQEQVQGAGCIYPSSTRTLMGELTAKHLTWRAYVEGMDSGHGAGPATCLHPAAGAADATLGATPLAATTTGVPAEDQVPPPYEALSGAAYATFRNPFVYFESVVDSPACADDDVSLSALAGDLSNPARTPTLSYIVPSLCDDASPIPCAAGSPAGLPPADAFLHKVVPKILASKAYKQGGLLVITVDQAPSTGVGADSSSCCGQPAFPALPPPPTLPGGGSARPTGGGQVGALLLSPYVKSGTTNQEPFNHFSLLRTIENLFGLPHLGYAAESSVGSFEAPVFTAYEG
jgi:phosphatidylinositol-3-phosphatase